MKLFRFNTIIMFLAALIMVSVAAAPSIATAQENKAHTPMPISLDEPENESSDAKKPRILMLDDDIEITQTENQTDEEELDLEDVLSEDDENDTEEENPHVKGHGLQLGMSFLGLPDSVFEIWFSKHGSVWKDEAINMGFSLDYTLRFKKPCEMRFSLSWMNAKTSDDYWLDNRFTDRPYLADYFVNNYSLVSLEVAAYHIVQIIDEIAFYYGGGAWGGVIIGDGDNYAIRSSCATSTGDLSVCPHEPGSVPLTQLPPVFGFVTVTLGFKFTILEIMTIRAEGGFKGYFYGQLGLGVEF